jgi:hypothetical protein
MYKWHVTIDVTLCRITKFINKWMFTFCKYNCFFFSIVFTLCKAFIIFYWTYANI